MNVIAFSIKISKQMPFILKRGTVIKSRHTFQANDFTKNKCVRFYCKLQNRYTNIKNKDKNI